MKFLRAVTAVVMFGMNALAIAQTVPSGTYFAPVLDLQFSFAPQPSGEIAGALIGATGEIPIHYVGDGVAYHGHFTVENITFGITAQLADSGVLHIWLYEFDQAGTPVEASYEWYEAELVQAPAGRVPQPPAQRPATAGNQPAELLGVWQAYSSVNDMQVSHVVYFDQSGVYEHGVYDPYGQLIYATAGDWHVEGNQLVQLVTDFTPQICVLGSCQPFSVPEAERRSSVPITFQNGGFTVVATSGQTLEYHSGVNTVAPPTVAMPNTGPMYNSPATGGGYMPPAYGGGVGDIGGGFVGGSLSPLSDNDHAKWINTVIYENYELDDFH